MLSLTDVVEFPMLLDDKPTLHSNGMIFGAESEKLV